MIARVKRWLYNDKPRTTPGQDHSLFIECEIVTPPSSTGRTVHLMLDASDVTALLVDLRDSAKRARR